MLRKFTAAAGRYRVGDVRDYPRDVWNTMARELKMKLESFSTACELDSLVAQSALKGKPVIHKRLGGTQ